MCMQVVAGVGRPPGGGGRQQLEEPTPAAHTGPGPEDK